MKDEPLPYEMVVDPRSDRLLIEVSFSEDTKEFLRELLAPKRAAAPRSKSTQMDGIELELVAGILGSLSTLTGRTYRVTTTDGVYTAAAQKCAQLLRHGYTEDQIRWVIGRKWQEWNGTDMEKYCRAETLFRKSKFEEYLSQCE